MEVTAKKWLSDVFGYSGMERGEMVFPAGQRGYGVVFREANFQGPAQLVKPGCSIPVMVSSQSQHGVRSFIFPPSKTLTMMNASGDNTSASHGDWWVVSDSCVWFKDSAAVTFLFAPITTKGRIPPPPVALPFEHCLNSPARSEIQRVIEQRTEQRGLTLCFSEKNFRGETTLFTNRDRIDFGTVISVRHLGSPHAEIDGGASPFQSMVVIPPWKWRLFLGHNGVHGGAKALVNMDSNQWHFIADTFQFLNQYIALSHIDWKVEDRVQMYASPGIDQDIDGGDGNVNRALALDLPIDLFESRVAATTTSAAAGTSSVLPRRTAAAAAVDEAAAYHHNHNHHQPTAAVIPPYDLPVHHHGNGELGASHVVGGGGIFQYHRNVMAIIFILVIFGFFYWFLKPAHIAIHKNQHVVADGGGGYDYDHDSDSDSDKNVMMDMMRNAKY